MDESLVCECGNDKMWFFWDKARCTQCYNEYKATKHVNPDNVMDYEVEYLMRRFNKEENKYPVNWGKSLITYKNLKIK